MTGPLLNVRNPSTPSVKQLGVPQRKRAAQEESAHILSGSARPGSTKRGLGIAKSRVWKAHLVPGRTDWGMNEIPRRKSIPGRGRSVEKDRQLGAEYGTAAQAACKLFREVIRRL